MLKARNKGLKNINVTSFPNSLCGFEFLQICGKLIQVKQNVFKLSKGMRHFELNCDFGKKTRSMWYFSDTLYPKHISIQVPLVDVTIPLTTKTKIGTEKAMLIAGSIYLVEVILNLEALYAIVYRKTEIRDTADMFS